MSKFTFGRVTYAIAACLVGLVGGDAARAQAPAGFAKLDVNEDGVLSGVEVGTVKRLDRNGDGVVTQEEFAGAESSAVPTMSAGEAERRFAQLDITEDDFLSGKEKAGYEKFDSNGDGLVTKAEFLAGAVGPAKRSDASPPSLPAADRPVSDLRKIVADAWAEVDGKLFDELDADGDGRLSGSEIRVDHKGFDTDGDGRLTKAEFLAGRAAKPNPPGTTPPPGGMPKSFNESVEQAYADAYRKRAEADARFQALDGNEDGRLSGTEIDDETRKFDADGDGRVTKEEFAAGYTAPKVLPPLTPPPAMGPKVGPTAGPKPAASVGLGSDDLAPLVAALQTGDLKPLLAAMNRRGRDDVDEPLVQFIVDLHRKEYGAITPPKPAEIKVIEAELKGEKLREATAEVKFERGAAVLKTGTADGRLEGIAIKSPLSDEFAAHVSVMLAQADSRDAVRRFSEFYGPTAEKMVRLMVDGDDEGAFAMFYPEVGRELGLDNVKAYFRRNRGALGKVESAAWSGLIVENDAEGNPKPSFKMECDLATAAGPVTATVTFQPIGLKAHITSFQLKKSGE